MTMKSKTNKKIAKLGFSTKQVIKSNNSTKIKGGAQYYCCVRNKWITT